MIYGLFKSCNGFGHLAFKCESMKSVNSIDHFKNKSGKPTIMVPIKDIEFTSLIESGSDLAIVGSTSYI